MLLLWYFTQSLLTIVHCLCYNYASHDKLLEKHVGSGILMGTVCVCVCVGGGGVCIRVV